MRVRDLLVAAVTRLTPEMTLESAAVALGRAGVGDAPVVDAAGRLVGMVTAAALRPPSPEGARTVRDVMAPPRGVLCADDTPASALEAMAVCDALRLPVVGGDGRLIGLVSREDARRAAGRLGDVPFGPPPLTGRWAAPTTTPTAEAGIAGLGLLYLALAVGTLAGIVAAIVA